MWRKAVTWWLALRWSWRKLAERLLKLGEGHEKAEEARALVFQFCRDRTVYGENRRHSPPVNRNRPQAATQLSILMWVNAKWLTLWQASTIEKQGQEE
jgi:hypothetical protein